MKVKVKRSLYIKARDGSTDRKKFALNLLELLFTADVLRSSTFMGSERKKRLCPLRTSALKATIFKEFPAQNAEERPQAGLE
ncbi:uncharacterized protein LOC110237037 [Exaiptasia diaphana]|uniref:Uncharacterized protein n=1 Tax=Exaiptasia diaphana TaxID=2652724 RepID=A0A913YG30_EXADI|nr:uncharacterized protein LOC110237037 [Exaiptasia diaphana]